MTKKEMLEKIPSDEITEWIALRILEAEESEWAAQKGRIQ